MPGASCDANTEGSRGALTCLRRSPPIAILRPVRLDEPKLEALRRWGQALREAGSEESVAAGRAILMLVEELERVRLELRRAREQLDRVDPVSNNEVDAGTGTPSRRHLTGVYSGCWAGTPINLLRPHPSRLKKQARAWKAIARPHRRIRGSRRYGEQK